MTIESKMLYGACFTRIEENHIDPFLDSANKISRLTFLFN